MRRERRRRRIIRADRPVSAMRVLAFHAREQRSDLVRGRCRHARHEVGIVHRRKLAVAHERRAVGDEDFVPQRKVRKIHVECAPGEFLLRILVHIARSHTCSHRPARGAPPARRPPVAARPTATAARNSIAFQHCETRMTHRVRSPPRSSRSSSRSPASRHARAAGADLR